MESSDQVAAISYPDNMIRVIETLRQQRSDVNGDRILAAYRIAAQAHSKQFRESGEAYINHPVAVAQIVAEMLRLHVEPGLLLHVQAADGWHGGFPENRTAALLRPPRPLKYSNVRGHPAH